MLFDWWTKLKNDKSWTWQYYKKQNSTADHAGDQTEVDPAVTQQSNQTVRTRCWPPSTILLLARFKTDKEEEMLAAFFFFF